MHTSQGERGGGKIIWWIEPLDVINACQNDYAKKIRIFGYIFDLDPLNPRLHRTKPKP